MSRFHIFTDIYLFCAIMPCNEGFGLPHQDGRGRLKQRLEQKLGVGSGKHMQARTSKSYSCLLKMVCTLTARLGKDQAAGGRPVTAAPARSHCVVTTRGGQAINTYQHHIQYNPDLGRDL
jgi:hypothetical protein